MKINTEDFQDFTYNTSKLWPWYGLISTAVNQAIKLQYPKCLFFLYVFKLQILSNANFSIQVQVSTTLHCTYKQQVGTDGISKFHVYRQALVPIFFPNKNQSTQCTVHIECSMCFASRANLSRRVFKSCKDRYSTLSSPSLPLSEVNPVFLTPTSQQECFIPHCLLFRSRGSKSVEYFNT